TRSSYSNSPSASSSSRAAARISGPIPSPGRTTMRGASLNPRHSMGPGSGGDCVDVEANVAKSQRVAGEIADVGQVALGDLGRQVFHLGFEDQRAHVLLRVRRDDLPWLQPGVDLGEPCSAQSLLGLLGGRVQPWLREVLEVCGEGLPRGDL